MIRPYRDEDFPFLEKWITDPFLLFQVAGPSWTYPITREQISAHQLHNPNKQLYVGLNDAGQPVAFGEIIHGEIHSPRLGRLLVGDPNLRSQGIGRQFIQDLLEECRRLHAPEAICLFVLETNLNAYSLYKKLGFIESTATIPDMEWNGEKFRVIKMVLPLKTSR
jgi:ribosomal protein S18 acetylase RimI-like enzyme